eukprot:6476126-Amphidinium_carterae.1
MANRLKSFYPTWVYSRGQPYRINPSRFSRRPHASHPMVASTVLTEVDLKRILDCVSNDIGFVEHASSVLKRDPRYVGIVSKLQDRPTALRTYLKKLLVSEQPVGAHLMDDASEHSSMDVDSAFGTAPSHSASPGAIHASETAEIERHRDDYKGMLGTDIVAHTEEDEWILVPEVWQGRSMIAGASLLAASQVAAATANAAAVSASAETAAAANSASSLASLATAVVWQLGLQEAVGVVARTMAHLRNSAVKSRCLTAGGTVKVEAASGKLVNAARLDLRCVESLTASVLCTASSIGGGMVGATLCVGAAAPGLVFAAACGAMVAAALTDVAVQIAFEVMFGDDRQRTELHAYQVLGLKRGASAEEVRASYLQLARIKHPKMDGGCKKQFLQVNAAYELIRAGC